MHSVDSWLPPYASLCRTLTAFSQGDWPLTCANAADARSETDFFRKAFFIAGEFLSDDASRAPHRIRKGNLSPDLVERDGERREPKVEVAASRREAAPWSHTSTPNRRWQNRECCQRVPIRGRAAVIFRHCCQRGIQRESPSNLTNGQETGKIFQRKMFHVLTVFFRLVRRFLLVWLAKTKSAFEMNDIRRGCVTCYRDPAGAVRPDQIFGRDSHQRGSHGRRADSL